MNKQKTRKSILKRFKISGTGKVFRGHPYARHRRAHKTNRRIRHFGKMVQLTLKQARNIKKLI